MMYGGNVVHHLPFWRSIGATREVLEHIKGVKIPFINNQPPKQTAIPRELKMSLEEQKFVDKEVAKLLDSGFIKKLDGHIPDGWVSTIFLVEKKLGNSFRQILNLKIMNESVSYSHFHMDGLGQVLKLLRSGDSMGSLDLVSAYGNLRIHEDYQKYFQFTWRGQFFCYVTLPQGYSDSPRIFTKCTSPIMAYLRKLWIDIIIYIDDTFLRAPTAQQLTANMSKTIEIFEKCGLTINYKKSCLKPTTCMEFLGFVLNTIDYSISVNDTKRFRLKDSIDRVLSKPHQRIKIRSLAKLIGQMVAMFPASDDAKMHYRTLERYKSKSVTILKSWSARIRLDKHCISELKWWSNFLKNPITRSLHKKPVTETIWTDSSGYGFGCVWRDEKVQGRFTDTQLQLSINTKELLAIYYSLSLLGHRLRNETLHIRCDNMCAIFCIKSFGSRDVLRDRLTRKVFHLARKFNISISISYVKSKDNISDVVSRKFQGKSVHTEWTLAKADFDLVMQLAHTKPQIDLFASQLNTKFKEFYSWGPCNSSAGVDSFTKDWETLPGYSFCPFSLIGSVLKKCVNDNVRHIAGVFPMWPTKSWWPNLMRLCGGQFTVLKGAGQRLRLPWDAKLRHPMGRRLTLIFANLSMTCYENVMFQHLKQPTSLKMPGETKPSKRKGVSSDDGTYFPKRTKPEFMI